MLTGVLAIVAAVAPAVIGAVADIWQGSENRKQQDKLYGEQKAMSEKQFAWGQNLDRFNMGIASRQQNEAETLQRHNITQDQVNRLNDILRTNRDVQNHVRSLWGGK